MVGEIQGDWAKALEESGRKKPVAERSRKQWQHAKERCREKSVGKGVVADEKSNVVPGAGAKFFL